MHFEILTEQQKAQYYDKLLEILTKLDNEFVPPLSQRPSKVAADLQDKSAPQGSVREYLDEILKNEKILGAFHDDHLVGIVAFLENAEFDMLQTPNIYICTVVVSPEARGMGLTKKAYNYLFHELYSDRNIYTRTWSTNIAHCKILDSFGFAELKRIPNDRGEGVDTVYFAKLR